MPDFRVWTDNERVVAARFGDGPIMRSLARKGKGLFGKSDEFDLAIGVLIACRRAYIVWQGYELPEVMYCPPRKVLSMWAGVADVPGWMLEEFLTPQDWEGHAESALEFIGFRWNER